MSQHIHKHLSRRSQTGGTLLGLIIGLVIGLGIAVGVALTINKTTLPFLNKVAKPDRAELTPGQATDPNKPLYGNKNPAKEAAKGFAAAPPAVDPAPPNSADPQAVKNAAAKEAAAQPVAEKPKKVDPRAEEGSDEKWTYYLQAGAFREQNDAESARAKLALLGFEAHITERPSDTGVLYRVRVGPFSQLDAMNRTRGKLTDSGVDVAVVRTPKTP
ncbi:cell division protein FtsN [Actimicrobium sp. GrIS 1.19]|uniref:SPOR domain-containing protein n=1 Tax=Actimicrobium sp. GrIS 1.19 TaxID=3071708 RepID=UPI002DFB98C8|nr:cell division protein FtsN [Actimicrobium sp. GrIS 1.19]